MEVESKLPTWTTEVTANTVRVEWALQDMAEAVLLFNIFKCSGDSLPVNLVAQTQDYFVELKSLAPDTSYAVKVVALLASGNQVVGFPIQFTTCKEEPKKQEPCG